MLKRLAITILATGCLCGAYGLYALCVTPMVQRETPVVQQQVKQRVDHPGKRGRHSEISEKYLPDSKWSWDALYQFHDGNRYIFTEKWERKPEGDFNKPGVQNPKGEIEFTPFAMVVINEDNPSEPPYTLVSRSAVLQFENGFESSNYNPGRIVGGALKGVYVIRGPQKLWLQGRNFFFQENPPRSPQFANTGDASPLAWSDDKVAFEYDGHRGTGHGLELKLIPDNSSDSQDKPAVTGIETIRLRDHVEMHLLKAGNRPGQPDERVQINSDGPFVFNLTTNTVSFRDVVKVVRRTVEGIDSLDSDMLHIVFREVKEFIEQPIEDSESAPPPEKKKKSSKREFSRLLARGRRVLLKSQHNNVDATMQELTYDGDEKQIVMKDGRQVHVRQKNNDFFCPELTLNQDENNEIISILGRGVGHMTSSDPDTNQVAYRAEWQKQIWKRPDPKSDQDILEFQEGARLLQRNKMGIEAELIRIWLEEDKTPRTAKTAGVDNNAIGADRKMKIQRLLARTNVVFAANQPEMSGSTKKLEVWFEEGKIPRIDETALTNPVPRERLVKLNYQRPQNRHRRPNSRTTLAGKTSQAPRRLANRGRGQALASTEDEIPADAFAIPSSRDEEAPPQQLHRTTTKKQEPYSIEADRIRIRVIREGDDHHVAEVRTVGHVSVDQKHQNGDEPLSIDCHQLTIQNEDLSNDHQIIWISGVPANDHTPEMRAHLRDKGMHVEGMKIYTNRRENRIEVKGAGLMQRPILNRLDGQKLQTPELLTVWWNQQMTFDGTHARFFDNVRLVLEDSELTCGQMDVELTNRISLIEREGDPRQEAEIRKVTCRDGVHMDSKQFEGNLLIGTQRGEVFELSMNQVTGKLTSSGGGWMESWRRDIGGGGSLGPAVSASSNRSVRSSAVQEWEYTKITFRGRMTGNISSFNDSNRAATTKFHDDVVVVYGPVNNPTQVVDPDDLPEMGGMLASDTLRLRRLPATEQSPKPYVTLLATGNARLDGQKYWGRADEVTYDGSSGQYTLRTAPKQGYAEIWLRERFQGKRNAHYQGQQVIVNQLTGAARVIGGRSLQGGN